MKPSDIRNLVLETMLEFERVKGGGKPKKTRKKKPKAKASAKRPIDIPAFLPKITDETLLRAAGTGPAKPKVNPFRVAVPPPGVLPDGVPAPSMAQDSAMGSALGWAGGFANQVFAEGLEFLGYPYLAELAQRPEYRVITDTIATEMTPEVDQVSGRRRGRQDRANQGDRGRIYAPRHQGRVQESGGESTASLAERISISTRARPTIATN